MDDFSRSDLKARPTEALTDHIRIIIIIMTEASASLEAEVSPEASSAASAPAAWRCRAPLVCPTFDAIAVLCRFSSLPVCLSTSVVVIDIINIIKLPSDPGITTSIHNKESASPTITDPETTTSTDSTDLHPPGSSVDSGSPITDRVL